jgi:hypothetical protein
MRPARFLRDNAGHHERPLVRLQDDRLHELRRQPEVESGLWRQSQRVGGAGVFMLVV